LFCSVPRSFSLPFAGGYGAAMNRWPRYALLALVIACYAASFAQREPSITVEWGEMRVESR